MGRRRLKELGVVVTPETLLRWYRDLIAKKYDGTAPARRTRMPWKTFLKAHLCAICTVDFFSVEVLTLT